MVTMQGGVFGAICTADELVTALESSDAPITNGMAEKGCTAMLKKALPYELSLPVGNTALIMIDFQRDFFEKGGFASRKGNDVSLVMPCMANAVQAGAKTRLSSLHFDG